MCAHSECTLQGQEYEAAPFGDLVITITHAKGLKEISEFDKYEAYCVITLVGTDYKYQTQTLVNVGEQGTPVASFTSFTSTKVQLLTQKVQLFGMKLSRGKTFTMDMRTSEFKCGRSYLIFFLVRGNKKNYERTVE